MPRTAPLVIDWQPDRTSPTPVTEQIVDYMCRRISSGAWPIGSRLPSQRTLAEQFHVNRSTVIAAINELADYGIVEGLHGAGTRIVSNTWSLMLPGAPDWADYVSSGFFKANNATIQTINRMEFAPGITRLGTGELDPRLFPRDMWRRVAGEAADEIDSIGYPAPEGMPVLREAIAAHMRATGIDCDAEQILVTSGALQALQMISVSLLSAGSTVIAEAPSYIKSLQVFQSAGMRLAGVPMDDDGLDVAALRGMLNDTTTAHEVDGTVPTAVLTPRFGRKDVRPGNAVLYTIPTNHNPTGITMSEVRRRELIDCCVANRLPIIEDGAYQDLYFGDGDGHSDANNAAGAPTPLKSLDKTGMVITLGSASKTLAPGLRIGWIVADRSIVHRLADVKMQMDYGASVLSQWVYARFLTSGLYDEYLDGLKRELRRRRDAAVETLDRLFGGRAHWTVPQGGFYIWLTFDQPVKIGRLFQLALDRGVLLNPGDIYDFEGDNSLRLSYSYTTPEEFARAAATLAATAREVGA
ncbi:MULTISPECIES: PLP-dependent aminotransferase family protein [Bifidobacterium]|uniref:aminotransferase-like domain-containing protein n=1 Tax=Bifidobacterium TaxID=1678 RepID=UPI001BDBBE13|nr:MULTISPECIES: PLP-dependent aminotransferase family protein [Bifidobacterium]MBT1161452.1 PLP-dependent aminotransferase family protein [Bifidobacterium sp. SO1]MBW3078981.1 PLP-dependent aminotransferase family protein [Bifidobacterium simiiventris]